MEVQLRGSRYPGRGIVLGMDRSGDRYVQVYWVMGRSDNSRNRVLVREGDLVRTEARDPSRVTDPSLIIYTAMTCVGRRHIVSNGHHTDVVASHLSEGGTFESAMLTQDPEPDAPNYTSRIAGLIDLDGPPSFRLAKVFRSPFAADDSFRSLYAFEPPPPGFGLCVHTYSGDGDPLPPFEGDPYVVRLGETLEEIAAAYWSALDEENRVALVVKAIDPDGHAEYALINPAS